MGPAASVLVPLGITAGVKAVGGLGAWGGGSGLSEGEGIAWPGAQAVGHKPKNQRGPPPLSLYRKVGLTSSTKEAGFRGKSHGNWAA